MDICVRREVMLMLNEYVVVPTKKEVEKNGAGYGRMTRTRYNIYCSS